jgi:large subunit ribosomal protein L10
MKAAAVTLKKFREKSDKPVLKGAWIDNGVFIGDDQLTALTELKSKEDLVGEVIGLLQSPARNVISALQSAGGKLAGVVKTLSER